MNVFNRVSCFVWVLFLGVQCPSMALGNTLEVMQDELDKRVSLFKRFHQKHERALVNAAQDDVFREYFMAVSEEEKKTIKAEIDRLSLNVQSKFKVDEMCLINNKGKEISRIVYQKIAPDEDLSPDEAENDFFKAALSLNARKVHISRPYMSADSLRWVICYATPIVLDDQSKPGLYHYEMPLYSLQETVNWGLGNHEDHYLLVVNKEGYILSDSRKKMKLELDPSDKEMEAPLKDYFNVMAAEDFGGLGEKIMNGNEGEGLFQAGGKKYRVAYKPLGFYGWSFVLVNKAEGS